MSSLSRAMSRNEVSALCGCALMLLLQAVDAAPRALEYRAALWLLEPWRLAGAHLVHINWAHALVNCAAWWLIVRLFADELAPRRQWLAIALGALAIDAGLALLYPSIAWYRGASGVLHTMFFTGAVIALVVPSPQGRAGFDWRTRWLPLVLVAGGAAKVVLEQPFDTDLPFADWLGAATVPQAHWLGAAAGVVLGAWIGGRARRRALSRSQSSGASQDPPATQPQE